MWGTGSSTMGLRRGTPFPLRSWSICRRFPLVPFKRRSDTEFPLRRKGPLFVPFVQGVEQPLFLARGVLPISLLWTRGGKIKSIFRAATNPHSPVIELYLFLWSLRRNTLLHPADLTYSPVPGSLNLHCFGQSFELRTAGAKSDGANAHDDDGLRP